MFLWTKSLLGTDIRTVAYSPLDGGETFTVKYDSNTCKLQRRLGPGDWRTIAITPAWEADTDILDLILTEHGYRPGNADNL